MMEKIQVIAIASSLLFFLLVLELVRNRRIREEYSILWLALALLFILIAVWRGGLEVLAHLLGIAYPPAAFFLVLIIGLFLIMIQFSVVISRLTEQNRHLAQELALLRLELSRFTQRLDASASGAGQAGEPKRTE